MEEAGWKVVKSDSLMDKRHAVKVCVTVKVSCRTRSRGIKVPFPVRVDIKILFPNEQDFLYFADSDSLVRVQSTCTPYGTEAHPIKINLCWLLSLWK